MPEINLVPDILIRAASNYPKHGVGYISSDGEIFFQKYDELFKLAKRYLYGLQKSGLLKGNKVIIVCNRNEEITPVLWACFLGGMVPTILQPPISFTSFNPASEKLEKVVKVMEDPYIIFSDDIYSQYVKSESNDNRYISYSAISTDKEAECDPAIQESETAFVQFSSGSTGDPKGIILTHKNILSNLEAISQGLDFQITDKTVNWMPLYHDMGLIGYHLAPAYGQYNQYLIDPVDFVKKPTIWLDVMEKVSCTITGCPNFGQALLLRHLKNKSDVSWDLSSIKAVTNGAEPISVRIMSEFIDKMKPFGFKKEAMMPVYGMAEATLAISFTKLGEGPTITNFDRKALINKNKAIETVRKETPYQEIVSVGKALKDIHIRITDDKDRILEQGFIGHVQLNGSSITTGYMNDKIATGISFDGEWLRTGDKGFFFDGNLYINGRYKDIIFINGKNYYANDLETLAFEIEGITFGKIVIGATFDETSGYDQLIVFIAGSLNSKLVELFRKIQLLFRNKLGIQPQIFIPIKSNQIPKTSSGKIQRYKLISQYLRGEFDEVIERVRGFL